MAGWVEGVTLKNPPFQIALAIDVDLDAVEVRAAWRVPDRETGCLTNIANDMSITLDAAYESGRGVVIHQILSWVIEQFAHEALECFHVDGQRFHDPHQ